MKKLIAGILCLCMMFSLAACNNGKTEEDALNEKKQAMADFKEDLNSQNIVAVNARKMTVASGSVGLAADIKNEMSGEIDVSNLVIAFAAWGETGIPVTIKTEDHPDNNTYYVVEMPVDTTVVAAENGTWTAERAMPLSEYCDEITYVEAIAVSGTICGKEWTNPCYDAWKEAYNGVILERWQMEEMSNNVSSGEVLGSDATDDGNVANSGIIDSTFTEFYTWLYGQDLAAFNADCEEQSDGRCGLMCDIKNNRDDASDIVVAFAMWDAEGKPIVINTEGGNSAYIIEATQSGLTIEWNEIWTADRGLYITNDDSSVAYVEAIVISAAVNGTVEENGMYDTWKEYFGGKSLTAAQLAEMERIETSYTTWLNSSENNDFEEWANSTINGDE